MLRWLTVVSLIAGCLDPQGEAFEVEGIPASDEGIPTWVLALEVSSVYEGAATTALLRGAADAYGHDELAVLGTDEVTILYGESSQRFVVTGDMPRDARVVPVYGGDGVYEPPIAVLTADGRAYQLDEGGYVSVTPTESAAPAIDVGDAVDDTVALRWMRTCPISLATCLLFGPRAAVDLAVDPVAPPGGWFLERESPAPEDEWSTVIAGTIDHGDEHIAYRWLPFDGALTVTTLDRSGRPSGEPVLLSAVPYFEIECGNAYDDLRIVFVRNGDHLDYAIAFGERDALLYEHGERTGRGVGFASAKEAEEDDWESEVDVTELPLVYRLEGEMLVDDAIVPR